MDERLSLRWICRAFDAGSGGILSRSLCAEYSRIGRVQLVDMEPDNKSGMDQLSPADLRRMRCLMSPLSSQQDATVSVRYAPPPQQDFRFWHVDSLPKVSRSVTFLGLPYGYLTDDRVRKGISAGVEVWVPSQYCRKTLVEVGLPSESVSVCPLGYNEQVFYPKGHVDVRDRVRFLHVSIFLEYCKGLDILLAAYCAAFSDKDPVELVLQCRPRNQDLDSLRNLVDTYRRPNMPRIRIVDRQLTQRELADLMRECDFYVQTSRAEAFGLPILEAMACGAAPICPSIGGHMDYIPPGGAIVVPSLLRRGDAARARREGLETVREWVEVDVECLVESLRWAAGRPDERMRIGSAAASYVRQTHTWRQAARRLYELVHLKGVTDGRRIDPPEREP